MHLTVTTPGGTSAKAPPTCIGSPERATATHTLAEESSTIILREVRSRCPRSNRPSVERLPVRPAKYEHPLGILQRPSGAVAKVSERSNILHRQK